MSRYRPIERPVPWQLRNMAVNEPVSGLHGRWIADQLAFLLAHNVAPVCQITPKRAANSSTATIVSFPYRPSTDGPRSLLVGVEVFGPGRSKVSISGGSFIETGAPALDGTGVIQGSGVFASINPVQCFKSVSAFSDTLTTIQVTSTPFASTYGSQNSGIRKVFALEIPRAMIDPVDEPTADPSVNYSWPIPPGQLVDGSASGSRGFKRVFSQCALARYAVRAHRTLATLEDTTNAWQTTSTSYTPLIAAGCEWYCRARRLYTTSSPNPQTLYVRYRSDQQWSLRVKTTVNGVTTNNDFTTIPANAGSFTTYTSSLNLSTAHNTAGEEQQVKVELEYKLNSAGTLYVSCVSLIENET